MIVYIYEFGLLKTGSVEDIAEEDLKDYIPVGEYELKTITNDFIETSQMIKAYVKRGEKWNTQNMI